MAEVSFLGLEIRYKELLLSRVIKNEDKVIVTHLAVCDLPLDLIVDGVVVEYDEMVSILMNLISSHSIQGEDIVVSISYLRGVKGVFKTDFVEGDDIDHEIESVLASHSLFSNDEFQFGYQVFRENIETQEKSNQVVIYGAALKTVVESIESVVSLLDLKLSAFDFSSLSACRAVFFNREMSSFPLVVIYIGEEVLDLFVYWQSELVYTESFRLLPSISFSNEEECSYYILKIKNFLFSFSNFYPHFEPISQVVFVSIHPDSKSFISAFESELFDFQVIRYSVKDNFIFEIEDLDESVSLHLETYVSVIGLALKGFETSHKSLSLVEYHRRVLFDFNKQALVRFFLGVLLMIVVILGVRVYFFRVFSGLDRQLSMLTNSLVGQGAKLFDDKKKEMRALESDLKFYVEIAQQQKPVIPFLYHLVNSVPSDLTFIELRFSDQGTVFLSGLCYYDQSLYDYVTFLEETYDNVTVKGVSKITLDDKIVNKFDIHFLKE